MKRLIFLLTLLSFYLCSFAQMLQVSSTVNLRTSPEIKKNIICEVPKGATVSVIDATTYEGWTKISYNNHSGYVRSNFLSEIPNNSGNYSYTGHQNNKVKHYTNSQGKRTQSPTYYSSAPAGATAECNDGTYSFSASRRGTCSHHGGVKRWLK